MRWLIILVFLIGFVSASDVTCTIVNDKVLIEIIGDDEVILPEDYSLLEIQEGKISFICGDCVRKDDEWIFVLPVILNSSYDLKVVLPSGFVLSDGLVYPKNYEIGSDGKSIILEWKNISDEVIVFYDKTEESWVWVWIILMFIFGGLFLVFGRKKSDFVLQNLFGVERQIVELLIKKKTIWMKDIVRELEISKVMATRKIRSLEEKDLVRKEKFGREWKIYLKK